MRGWQLKRERLLWQTSEAWELWPVEKSTPAPVSTLALEEMADATQQRTGVLCDLASVSRQLATQAVACDDAAED